MKRIGEVIAKQNNRSTENPLFVVFDKKNIPTKESYACDRVIWIEENEGFEAPDGIVEIL